MYQVTKDQIIEMTNNKKREEFLNDYKAWGIAHEDSYTKETYYECMLPNHARIVAMHGATLVPSEYRWSCYDRVSYFCLKDTTGRTFKSCAIPLCEIVNELKKLRMQYTRKE